MFLLVDTYNVVLRDAESGPDQVVEDAAHLAHLVRQSRYRNWATLLVCDGTGGRPTAQTDAGFVANEVRIRFAGPGRDADTLIEQLIGASTSPKRYVVVSSDQRIRVAARRRRCKTVQSIEFLRTLFRDAAAGTRSHRAADTTDAMPQSVEEWISHFEVDEQTQRIPRSSPAVPRQDAAAVPHKHPEQSVLRGRTNPLDDPVLREAIEHFGARLPIDDLDMERWLGPGQDAS